MKFLKLPQILTSKVPEVRYFAKKLLELGIDTRIITNEHDSILKTRPGNSKIMYKFFFNNLDEEWGTPWHAAPHHNPIHILSDIDMQENVWFLLLPQKNTINFSIIDRIISTEKDLDLFVLIVQEIILPKKYWDDKFLKNWLRRHSS